VHLLMEDVACHRTTGVSEVTINYFAQTAQTGLPAFKNDLSDFLVMKGVLADIWHPRCVLGLPKVATRQGWSLARV
jgi:hypothetical protein